MDGCAVAPFGVTAVNTGAEKATAGIKVRHEASSAPLSFWGRT